MAPARDRVVVETRQQPARQTVETVAGCERGPDPRCHAVLIYSDDQRCVFCIDLCYHRLRRLPPALPGLVEPAVERPRRMTLAFQQGASRIVDLTGAFDQLPCLSDRPLVFGQSFKCRTEIVQHHRVTRETGLQVAQVRGQGRVILVPGRGDVASPLMRAIRHLKRRSRARPFRRR